MRRGVTLRILTFTVRQLLPSSKSTTVRDDELETDCKDHHSVVSIKCEPKRQGDDENDENEKTPPTNKQTTFTVIK
jgi:hypothetical protein